MPALSPTMEEGTLAKWHVKEGDFISAGDIIADIETDKATMEVEAVDEGVLGKILVPEGSEGVKVNAVIAILLEEGESAKDIGEISDASEIREVPKPAADKKLAVKEAKPKTANEQTTSTTKTTQTPTLKTGERIFASPLARRIAKEANIDISLIKGSGPRGRIIKVDVEKVIKEGLPIKAKPIKSSIAVSSGMSNEAVKALYEIGTYEERKNDGMRTVVAERLTEAKQTIPHFYLTIECQLDNLLKARAEINASAPKNKDGKPEFKLSVNDFIVKAWALTLQKVPEGNATWAGDSILYHKVSDVAVAVAVPGGLFTPVVRAAESKTLRQISAEIKDYAIRAKSKKLAPHEYQGGSSAISNLGMFGIKQFAAVINPPHGTILAIGTGSERVYAKNGEIKTGTFMDVTLSCDHRAVDGALGALMLDAFKKMIENPVMMLA